MNVIRLGCGRAGTLFYEPDGLLLRSCLIPVDKRHSEHLLTFQLGYLGPGEITVHVALDGGPVDSGDLAGEPSITAALLRGTESLDDDLDECAVHRHRIPGVWLTYVSVPDAKVSYRYTVWGQPGVGDDDLRGELTTEVSGLVPLLTATTRVGATRTPVPDPVRAQAVFDWNQDTGGGNTPPPPCYHEEDGPPVRLGKSADQSS
jgi:hypothetical protein